MGVTHGRPLNGMIWGKDGHTQPKNFHLRSIPSWGTTHLAQSSWASTVRWVVGGICKIGGGTQSNAYLGVGVP